MFCDGTQSKNGESSGSQEANVDVKGKGKETTNMSRESSQGSGEDMSRGESSTTNTTVQDDDTLSEMIQIINKLNLPPVSPQAAQMTFGSLEEMKDLAHTKDLLDDVIKQVAGDIKEFKKHIAGLKSALNMGSTDTSKPTKRLDPTRKDFEPGWAPRNGCSMARLKHLNFLLEELIKEARRLEMEFKALKKTWEVRFGIAETEPAIAPEEE